MQAELGYVVAEHHEAPLRCGLRHQDSDEEGAVGGVAVRGEMEEDDNDIMGSKSVVPLPCCECPVCQKKFSKAWLVDEHVYQAHSDITSPYQCNYCQLFFHSYNALKVHLEMHKPSQDHLQHCCQECDALYTSWSSLKCHKATHNEPEYECKVCTHQGHVSFFHTYSMLMQHISLQHITTLDADLVCKGCEKGPFWNAQVLKQHI